MDIKNKNKKFSTLTLNAALLEKILFRAISTL